jgi:tetratricopeptide (TPR) repeat protein
METVQQTIERGLQLHMAGRVADAEPLYQQALSREPQNAAALHLLGVALSQMGRKPESVEYITRAIAINPNVPDFHVNLALVYIELGNPVKAVPHCQRALQLNPNHPDAYNHMGVALGQLNRIDQAVLYLRKTLELKENHTDALMNLGALYQQLGRFEESLMMFQRLIQVQGPRANYFQIIGDLLRELKRIPDAEVAYRKAVELDPNLAEGWAGLALLLHEKGDMPASIPLYEKACAIKPDVVTTLSNFGLALVGTGQLERGFQAYHRALELRPDFPNALNNLGNAYREKLDMPKTLECYDRALFFKPDHHDARWNRSLLLLLLGRFEEGWLEYEWRWLKFPEERRNFAQARWDGFDISGKRVLLFAEQGFGDTIQFARFIPLVAERGAKVVVECQPELAALIKTAGGAEIVVERGETVPPTDYQCPLMSLGRVFATDADNIPRKVPYLRADTASIAYWREKLRPQDGTLKVGIAWAGAARHHRDRERSMKRSMFAPLRALPEVSFFSLQKGPPANESADRFPLIDHTNDLKTFADTAAMMENLDLIISVDTSVVHLAGALGKPIWTMIPFLPDWRWLLEREDTPWYPTMRLFRQNKANDWSDVVDRLLESLRRFERPVI